MITTNTPVDKPGDELPLAALLTAALIVDAAAADVVASICATTQVLMCMCMFMHCVYLCLCLCLCMHTHKHIYIRTYVYAYAQMYARIMSMGMRTYARTVGALSTVTPNALVARAAVPRLEVTLLEMLAAVDPAARARIVHTTAWVSTAH